MEDRHAFSDPRPAYGNTQPTWNVDVYREGVPDPVFTLLINEETMPPRMRKKKVVWRLPDDQELLPSFGAEDKKRLVDLFKVQKKATRRKSKVKRANSGQMGEQPTEPNPADDAPEFIQKKEDSVQDTEKKKKNTGANSNKAPGVKKEDETPAPPRPARKPVVFDKAPESKPGNRQKQQQQPTPPPPPGMMTSPGKETTPLGSQKTMTPLPDSPSGGSPPPGFTLDLTDSPGLPPGKFFTVAFTSSNVPVDLAQTFMDVYYCSMTHGEQEDLLLHYVPGAVKSLSLGGAHSFCKSRQELLLQLNSLQGSLWDVSGVVAQEGFMNSIVLLLTGTCLPKTSPQPIPFCHSITLVKAAEGYQIHNDAMSLLTVGR